MKIARFVTSPDFFVVDEPFVTNDNKAIYALKDVSINLEDLLNVLEHCDGCCLDNAADIEHILDSAAKVAQLVE